MSALGAASTRIHTCRFGPQEPQPLLVQDGYTLLEAANGEQTRLPRMIVHHPTWENMHLCGYTERRDDLACAGCPRRDS